MQILMWGIGKWSELYYKRLNKDVRCIGFIETEKSNNIWHNLSVYEPNQVMELKYDYILVANHYSDDILLISKKLGIEKEKLCFVYPITDCNKAAATSNCRLAGIILNIDGADLVCRNYNIYIPEFDKVKLDFSLYNKMNKRKTFIAEHENYRPIRDDINDAGGLGTYFWQDLWAAKKIEKQRPNEHFDIGSRVDGFILALLAGGIKLKLIDIRPLNSSIEGIEFICADATNMDSIQNNALESLSALCSLEHFGLGRYGDGIDPEACFKCFSAIQNKMKSGGKIYIAVPIGTEHVEFNAHRIFYAQTIINCFNKCRLIELSATDGTSIDKNIMPNKYDNVNNGAGIFGLFEFERL